MAGHLHERLGLQPQSEAGPNLWCATVPHPRARAVAPPLHSQGPGARLLSSNPLLHPWSAQKEFDVLVDDGLL
jgi:hypothetical protein